MRLPLEGEAATRLAIFATRPGILCLPLNLLTKFLATGVFVLLLLMLWQQARFMGARPPAIRRWAEPLIIAAC
jgi:glycerol uptake facilitator-like aquaporin